MTVAALAFDPLAPTIFHENWWLDIVTRGRIAFVEAMAHGKVVGRLPCLVRGKLGIRYNLPPAMTHFLGPAINEGDGNAATRFLHRNEIIKELLEKLPDADVHHYKCHGGITDAIAFQQQKFRVSVQFTHVIHPEEPHLMWQNMRHKKRSKIRRARESLQSCEWADVDAFWDFYVRSLAARGIENHFDPAITKPLIAACIARDQGKIYVARNEKSEPVAAIFIIWDRAAAYYYLTVRTADAHDGAISMLVWEAMQDAAHRGLAFDFDGLNDGSAVLFFTEFGGSLAPRYIVNRATRIGRVAWEVRENFRENRFFC
jgi:hypothetical protein